MLAIGRALLLNPQLLMMDEPSEGLAPTIVENVIETCHAFVGEGMGILLVEQNLGVATSIAERQLVMVAARSPPRRRPRRCRRPRRPAALPRRRVGNGALGPRTAPSCQNPRMLIDDAALLRDRGFIDGAWSAADTGATFPVHDPATGEALAEVPRMGAAETRRAIEAAAAALPAWRARPARERAAVLRGFSDLMLRHRRDLAMILTREQGKPLAEADAEIGYAAAFLEWFGEEAKRVYGDTIPAQQTGTRIVVLRQPVGVCGGITPWNFPSAMITRKAAPALAAGNTIVCKPAEQTPLSALALAELADRAGVPAGVFQVVTGDAQDAPAIGGELTGNPTVRKIGFTGSTAVGKLLMAQCAGQVKKLSLELGGNAPFLVFDDADLDAAVAGAVLCKFRNSGQVCIAANRLRCRTASTTRSSSATPRRSRRCR